MNRKIFLSIVVTVLIILTGYFVVQLNAAAAFECFPYFNYVCDAQAQMLCGGADYFSQGMGSWCNGNVCRSAYNIYCETVGQGVLQYADHIYCDDTFSTCSGPN